MDKLSARSTICQQFIEGKPFPVRCPSLEISELPLAGIIRLQGKGNDPLFQAAVSAALALSLPAPESVSGTGDVQIAWTGPNEWLCFCPLSKEESCLGALTDAVAGQFATVTLVSDSRIGLVVTGQDAAALLSKGCAIDLHPVAFPVGHVVTTRFAGLPSMLTGRSASAYVLYFDVGSTEYMLNWIIDAADEFVALSS